jgi:hypothetical protein
MKRGRVVLAFVIAPAVTAVCWSLGFAVLGVIGNDPNVLSTVLFIGFWVGAIAYAHTLLIGVPVATLLLRAGSITLRSVVLSSALIGAVPYALYAAYQELSDTSGSSSSDGTPLTIDGVLTVAGFLSHLSTVAWFAASGIVAGLAWLVIARSNSLAPHMTSDNALEQTRYE